MMLIKMMNSSAVKNTMAVIEIRQFPISLSPAGILESVTGSVTAAVSL